MISYMRRKGVSYLHLIRLLRKMRLQGQAVINQTQAGQGTLRTWNVTDRMRFLKRLEFARSFRI